MTFFQAEYLNRENGARYSPSRVIWLNSEYIEAFAERAPGKTEVVLMSGTPYLLLSSGDALMTLLVGKPWTSDDARLRARVYALVETA